MVTLTVDQILDAFSESETLADEVLAHLNHGMWEEWDCDILTGVFEHGFGGKELQIAAQAAPRKADNVDTRRDSER